MRSSNVLPAKFGDLEAFLTNAFETTYVIFTGVGATNNSYSNCPTDDRATSLLACPLGGPECFVL